MNNNNKVVSPFASRENMGMINVSDDNHPVKEEVRKLCSNSYTIKVTFEEDKETNKVFAHIPGLITILCKFSIDGQVIAIGRSYSVFF